MSLTPYALTAYALHVLINHTGGPPAGPTNSATLDAFAMAFLQHVLVGQALLNAVLPGMRGEGYGRIIDIISTTVKQPIAGLGVSHTARRGRRVGKDACWRTGRGWHHGQQHVARLYPQPTT